MNRWLLKLRIILKYINILPLKYTEMFSGPASIFSHNLLGWNKNWKMHANLSDIYHFKRQFILPT